MVTPQQAPQLHGIVDRVCALADMSKPRVAISTTPLPNAFATGRNADKSVLCVTTGLMNMLTPEELEGVIAHELSHVAHKDVQVMTIASFLAIIAGLLIRFSFYGELFGGGGRRSNNNNGGALPIFLIIMGVSIVVYAVSFLLIRLLSRYRELAADRSGALLTGQPSALKSALVKVSSNINRIPTKDLRSAEPLNAFFFAPAAHLTPAAGRRACPRSSPPTRASSAGWPSWTRSSNSSTSASKDVASGLPGHPAGPDQAGPAQAG